uniref:Uncharacterized protein n=1 Tax=Avena sativa TaxID=4498 RepID=A0ACD5XRB2_AVESA
MVSPHYEVFKIPTLVGYGRGEEVGPSMEESEWPPYLCKMYVFSSKSGCWEEKDFVREGDAARTVGKVRAGWSEITAAYFRGALYVHCETDFLMRVSLSNNTYNVIKSPMGINVNDCPEIIIARSEKGVYFVALDTSWPPEGKCRLRVWILDESCGQTEWILKHDKDLKHTLPRQCFCRRDKWILEDINYNLFRASSFPEENKKTAVEKKLEFNSNNDSATKECYRDEEHYDDLCREDIELLGFHPYKEIVFLSASQQTCLAYHLNDSKIEELGNIYPKEYVYFKTIVNEREWIKSFPYTPCWIEEFPGNN